MKTAVYVGAGTDILPLLLFPTIREWIYIDSQPRSEWGALEGTPSLTFLPQLHALLQANGWVREPKDTDDALTYQNPITHQRLTYWINCAFPEHLTDTQRARLATVDTLVLIGHDPVSLLEMLPPRLHLITNLHTIYDRTVCFPDRTITRLAAHPDRIASLVQIRETRPYEHWTDALPSMEYMHIVPLRTWEELEASDLHKQQLYPMT